ncbi:MAG: hypothetical protein EA379_03820 [Phycisphaerales bacterium]|nr:MAG: hypothetical protein EA379_03820 [Phycisphaerales bacterium]
MSTQSPESNTVRSASFPPEMIIAGAMLLGLVMFTVIAAGVALAGASPGVAPSAQGGPGADRILGGVALAMMLTTTPVAYVIRRRILARAAAEDPQARMMAVVIPISIVESYGLLGAVVVLISGEIVPYIVIPAVAIAAMAALLPRRSAGAGGSSESFGPPERWS